jgi:hypothetical protein
MSTFLSVLAGRLESEPPSVLRYEVAAAFDEADPARPSDTEDHEMTAQTPTRRDSWLR